MQGKQSDLVVSETGAHRWREFLNRHRRRHQTEAVSGCVFEDVEKRGVT